MKSKDWLNRQKKDFYVKVKTSKKDFERVIIINNNYKLGSYIKPRKKRGFIISTRGRTRTGTSIWTTDFKAAVSTNSTTQAT